VQKNLIIGGLIVWNLILMAALVIMWFSSRRIPEEPSNGPLSAASEEPRALSGEQSFTYQAGDRLVGDKAPLIANRDLTMTITFDTQGKDGVIMAHGGLAHGYGIYVEGGQLFFVVRRNNALTTVDGGSIAGGRHVLTATLSKTGEMNISLDGKSRGIGKAAGGIPLEPVDGLDVGGDRGAPVGPYPVPSDFGGTIESVSLKTVP